MTEKSLFVGGPLHGQLRDVPLCKDFNHLVATETTGVQTVKYHRDVWAWQAVDGPHRQLTVRWTEFMPDWLQILDALAIAYGFGERE